ncbi:peptidylprolyl isomerase [Stieleria sp. JC731]|uniref:peptidylprolyl isomerase n=1 Tax=Pirellulaceae TaxID=2691357 RepID=UPI001E4E0253|nr:peptidylprolyl isomerase [Stieleria sp. JC731]MCC9603661.1 peptidylprolyl isomerase [Stieleria sp. JC731]
MKKFATKTQLLVATFIALLISIQHPIIGIAQSTSGQPSEPIVAVDGAPISNGALNLLLKSKLKIDQPNSAPLEVRRAAVGTLLNQHLALSELRKQGGEKLQSMIDRSWDNFINGLAGNGESTQSLCRRFGCSEGDLRDNIAWETSWREYLRSKMTDANLARFYAGNIESYAPTSWDLSHLFVAIDPKDSQSSSKAVKIVQNAYSELSKVQDSPSLLADRFSQMAIEFSDGSTASQGGKIGWVSESGDLPENVMQAVRRTSSGKVTYPVRSSLGMHLVLVHDQQTKPVAFEELRDRTRLRRDAANFLFENLVGAGKKEARISWFQSGLKPDTRSSADPSVTDAASE